MTRMQEMSLDYHFTVEQEVGSSTYAFFGFNGNYPLSKIQFFPSFFRIYFLSELSEGMKYSRHTGTAGVWRINALNEAGGWKDRTTVEDMDLAVRASLKGWKFVYVGSLKV